MNRFPFFRKLFLSLVLIAGWNPAFALDNGAQKPQVAVLPAENASGLDSFDAGAKASYDTVVLTLRQSGLYELIPWTGSAPSLKDMKALAAEAEKRSLDYLVAVRLEKSGPNTVKCRIAVFDRSKGILSFDRSSSPAELIDVFDASDETVAEVFTAMTGKHIGFGSIVLQNSGEKGAYRILLDNNPIKESSLSKVLAGTHDIRIVQTRMLGDKTWAARVTVTDRQSVGIPFDIPYLTDAESVQVAERKKAVDQLWDNPSAGPKMDQALKEWEALFADVSYSPRLVELKKEVQAKRAAWTEHQKELASRPRQNPEPAKEPASPAPQGHAEEDISAGISFSVTYQEDFQSMEDTTATASLDQTIRMNQYRIAGYADLTRYCTVALGFRRVLGDFKTEYQGSVSGVGYGGSNSYPDATFFWMDFSLELKLPLHLGADWIFSPKLGLEYSRMLGGNVPGGGNVTEQDRNEMSPLYAELGLDLDYYLTPQVYLRVPVSAGLSLISKQPDGYYGNLGMQYMKANNFMVMAGLAVGYTF